MTETPIKAVELMRALRGKIDQECQGMSWEERRAYLHKKIEANPALAKWLSKAKAETSS